jgi:translation initiation factor IF-2
MLFYDANNKLDAALRRQLEPREEVSERGRAFVLQTSTVGGSAMVACCYVTHGSIERSAQVRVIRQGVVIHRPRGSQAGLDSLKRVGVEVAEVREGCECTMSLAGRGDVRVGDVIAAYPLTPSQDTP